MEKKNSIIVFFHGTEPKSNSFNKIKSNERERERENEEGRQAGRGFVGSRNCRD